MHRILNALAELWAAFSLNPFMFVWGVGFTYGLSGLALYALLARWMGVRPGERLKLWALTLGLGPLVVSWFFVHLLMLAPGRSNGFYGTLVVVPFLGALVWGRGACRDLWSAARAHFQKLAGPVPPERALLGLPLGAAAMAVGLALFYAMVFPLTQNDPLEYGILAKHLYQLRTTAFYPVLNPVPQTGYYDVVAHPLGFGGLIAWHLVLQGTAEFSFFPKLIAPMFYFFTVLLAGVSLRDRGVAYGVFGAFLVALSPLFFRMATYCHVDPIRVYPFFATLVSIAWFARRPGVGAGAVMAVTMGSALYTHSIAILLPPMAGIAFLAVAEGPLWSRFLRGAAVVGGGLLWGGDRFIANLFLFGSPINNEFPLFREFGLQLKDLIRYQRGILTFDDRLKQGFLRGFIQLQNFGIGFWLALAAVVLQFRRLWEQPLGRAVLVVLSFFYGMVLLSLAFGIDYFVMNERYLLTLVPFVSVLGANLLGTFYDRFALSHRAALDAVGDQRAVRRTLLVSCLWSQLGVVGVSVFLMGPSTIVGSILDLRWFPISPATDGTPLTDFDKMARSPLASYHHVATFDSVVPRDSLVLLFRLSDIGYYAQVRYIRDSDPRMAAVYRAGSKEEAFRALREIGIDYIYLPYYMWPSFSDTPIQAVAADLQKVELVGTYDTNRLYRIRRPGEQVRVHPLKFDPMDYPTPYAVGPFTDRVSIPTSESFALRDEGACTFHSPERTGRDLVVGRWGGFEVPAEDVRFYFPIAFSVKATASGQGLFHLLVRELDEGGRILGVQQVWDGSLRSAPRAVEAAFHVSPRTARLELMLRLMGAGEVRFTRPELHRTDAPPPRPPTPSHAVGPGASQSS